MTPIMVASLYHSMHLSTRFGLSLVKLQFHSPIFLTQTVYYRYFAQTDK